MPPCPVRSLVRLAQQSRLDLEKVMHITTATREYEAWVAGHTPMVRGQLFTKHKRMAQDPVQVLRGTFYRWTQMWPDVCPELAKSVNVLAVGDLHIASFGTWRDAYGRLVWGIDDFDEAYPMGYANGLVRLGVSAIMDEQEGALAVGVRDILRCVT